MTRRHTIGKTARKFRDLLTRNSAFRKGMRVGSHFQSAIRRGSRRGMRMLGMRGGAMEGVVSGLASQATELNADGLLLSGGLRAEAGVDTLDNYLAQTTSTTGGSMMQNGGSRKQHGGYKTDARGVRVDYERLKRIIEEEDSAYLSTLSPEEREEYIKFVIDDRLERDDPSYSAEDHLYKNHGPRRGGSRKQHGGAADITDNGLLLSGGLRAEAGVDTLDNYLAQVSQHVPGNSGSTVQTGGKRGKKRSQKRRVQKKSRKHTRKGGIKGFFSKLFG